MSDLIKALEALLIAVRRVSIRFPMEEQAFQDAVTKSIETQDMSHFETAGDEFAKYKNELADDLRAFVEIATDHDVDCVSAANLRQALLGGFDALKPFQYIHGTLVEIELLKAKLTKPIAGITPYPWPKSYAKDQFIYENIASMSRELLILELGKRKNFGNKKAITTGDGFKKAAQRYSDYHKLPAKNFQGEKPDPHTDTE